MSLITVSDIEEAFFRIKSLIIRTPLITNETINSLLDAKIYFKLENLQKTGSFKFRGASNKISLLSENEKKRGVVAYSSGNHGQAVACASYENNINATIIMPKNAPKIKINNTKRYGAKILLYDPFNENRERISSEISKREGKKIIKPYDDLDIISGQGTVSKEIVEQLKIENIKPDIYLCCCGGGGLISGSSLYLKHYYPNIKNYSVEPEHFNDTQRSLENKKIVSNKKLSQSICDALLAPQPGNLTFSINKRTLKGGLVVSDLEVKKTIIQLAENLKVIVEPGGAVAASALFYNKINIKKKNVVVMISGGNIDYNFFSTIVEQQYE